jgi:steroid 5-alpha reductase family enzyme
MNWIRSWPNLLQQDWRYTKLKEDNGVFYWPVSFLGIHLFPTLIVFLGMLPVYKGMSSTDPLNFMDYIGVIIAIGAIILEYLSDEQLRIFKRSNPGKGANMEKGLWSKSRHPNYLGEILFWLGLFLFSFKDFINGDYWTSYGVIAMVILFRVISIPMMEKRLVKSKNGYKDYQKKVKSLIPNLF